MFFISYRDYAPGNKWPLLPDSIGKRYTQKQYENTFLDIYGNRVSFVIGGDEFIDPSGGVSTYSTQPASIAVGLDMSQWQRETHATFFKLDYITDLLKLPYINNTIITRLAIR